MDKMLMTAALGFASAMGGIATLGAVFGPSREEPEPQSHRKRPTEPLSRPTGPGRNMVDRQRERQARSSSAPAPQQGNGPVWDQDIQRSIPIDESGAFSAWLHDRLQVPPIPDEKDTIIFVALFRDYFEYCEKKQLPTYGPEDFARNIKANADTSRYGYMETGDLIGAKFRN